MQGFIEFLKDYVDPLTSIPIGLVGFGIVIWQTVHFLKGRRNLPKFNVGILPSPSEMDQTPIKLDCLRKDQAMDECHFEKKFLALENKNWGDKKFEKRLENQTDCKRIISVGETDKIINLPIMIQNMGNQLAKKYSLVISFDDQSLLIRDVVTETLEVDAFYVQDGEINNPKLKRRIPDIRIRQEYERLGLQGPFISLRGTLETHAFELLVLSIERPADVIKFTVFFKIDLSTLDKRLMYAQKVEVVTKQVAVEQ